MGNGRRRAAALVELDLVEPPGEPPRRRLLREGGEGRGAGEAPSVEGEEAPPPRASPSPASQLARRHRPVCEKERGVEECGCLREGERRLAKCWKP